MIKILYADDEKNVRETAAAILESWGIDVVLAEDGRAVLDIVKEDDISLVMLDVVMPVINGFLACRILKESPDTKDIPVIILSALNTQKYISEGKKNGADFYMSKPADWEVLKEKIFELVNKKNLNN